MNAGMPALRVAHTEMGRLTLSHEHPESLSCSDTISPDALDERKRRRRPPASAGGSASRLRPGLRLFRPPAANDEQEDRPERHDSDYVQSCHEQIFSNPDWPKYM